MPYCYSFYMPRCLYCLEEKPDADFNTEHVVPKSFGTFGPETPVLRCVCEQCNRHLGRELDEKIARDSVEGLDRVAAGLKEGSEFKTLGKRSSMYVEFDKNGPLLGARGFHIPAPDGKSLAVTPLPQIGFSRSSGEPFEWFTLDQLPTKEELVGLGYERGRDVLVHTWGMPISAAQDALETKGFARGTLAEEKQPPTGRVRSQIVARIAVPELRAYAKIALNYLAFVERPAFVFGAQFNDIRRFVRYGVEPRQTLVEVGLNPWLVTSDAGEQMVGHYVVVRTRGGVISADVCLFGRLRYRVVLADGGFIVPVAVQTGHLFDVPAQKILAIPVAQLPG